MKLLAAIAAVALSIPSAAPAQDANYSTFIEQVNRALEFNDEKGLDRAIRSHPGNALWHFDNLYWTYKTKQDPAQLTVIDQMKASWERTFKSRTLGHIEDYVIAHPMQHRNYLIQALNAERGIYELYALGVKNKDRAQMVQTRNDAVNLARKYEELGHPLYAAKLWSLSGEITLRFPSITANDRREASAYLQNFLNQRDQWGWQEDTLYKVNKNLVKAEQAKVADADAVASKRQAEGYDSDVMGVDALVLPTAEEEISDLSFKPLSKPHVDPFVMGGTVPPLWLPVRVDDHGPAKMEVFADGPLYLVRPASNKFGVTTSQEADLDKNPWQAVDPSGKFKASIFYLGPNKTKPYAMWFYVGGESEPMFGMSHNLAPQDASATVYYKCASSWVATLAGETVTFFDDNANGKLFEADPYAYGLRDRTRTDVEDDGQPVPAYDGMKIAKGQIQPLSGFAKIGEQWMHLRSLEDGTKVSARPLNPEYVKFGTVQLKWQGPRPAKPEMLIIQGTGDFETARFNLASGKPIEVPASVYEITFGRITMGKGARTMQAQIYKGSMEPIVVEAGEAAVLKLGKPFQLDFERGGEGSEVLIDPMSMRVVGASGEVYCRINGATPLPDVMVSKKKGAKSGKVIGSFVMMGPEQVNQVAGTLTSVGIEAGFFGRPKGKWEGGLVFKGKLPYAKGFVGLRQKKNKLFGKLDPIFK